MCHHVCMRFIAGGLLFLATVASSAAAQERKEYESGDPRGLPIDVLRAIRHSLIEVRVDRDSNLYAPPIGEEPPHPNDFDNEIQKGWYRVRYFPWDEYMLLREAEIYHEIGLRAWTVEFTGGPMQLWWDIEKEGDVSTEGMIGGPEEEGVRTFNLSESGTLLFVFLPGSLRGEADELPPARRHIIETLDKHESSHPDLHCSGIRQFHTLRVIDGHLSTRQSAITPILWSRWHGVAFTQHAIEEPVDIVGECVLLDIEAVEQDAPDGKSPRRVRLKLIAEPDDTLSRSQSGD